MCPHDTDSNGPIINTVRVCEPQAETDSLKLFWFWPNVCSQYIDNISTTKGGSEHTNSQYFLA